MATYKKKSTKAKKQVHIEDHSATAEVFNTLDETASRSERWLEKNQKPIFIGLIVLTLAILGYLAYNNYILEPREKEAADELAFPKEYFERAQNSKVAVDSLYNLAINGANGKYGLVDIVDTYGGTKAGNIAKYMTGISYLKLGEYDKSIEYLNKFKSDDEILAALAKGNIGDAFVEINQPKDAIKYYLEAAKVRDNEFTTPLYLFKAANTAMELEDYDQAIKLYNQIKDDYTKSDEAKKVDIFIQRAEFAAGK
jgi:tetratricopeptide (TPR) repeat protein